MQQITIDNDQKYFIFGIKFDDIYIPEEDEEEENEGNNNPIKFFVYEKTYLFISDELLCKLFENIFNFILKYKKLIFCQNLSDYNSLMNKEKNYKFNELNQESVRNIILLTLINL